MVLVLLPGAVFLLASFPQVANMPTLSWFGFGGLGFAVLVAFRVRDRGQTVQRRLFLEWGGAPTTRYLRHRDPTIPRVDKARYHLILQANIPGLKLPTAEQEKAYRANADAAYASAIAWLRERTKDRERFPVVFSEDVTYGFFRNLTGVRRWGLTCAIASLFGSIKVAMEALTAPSIVSLIVSLACAVVFSRYASDFQVQRAANQYAIALIQATDAFDEAR